MKNNWNKILNELSYKVSSGIPDLTNEQHLMKLWDILKEHNWNIDARVELLKNLNEVSIVKNKKSGNVYPVKTFRPQTQTIIKKDATKDDIKKAQQGAGEDEFDKPKEEPKEAQSNGYTGDKDKTLKQGDANKSEEFNKDLPPSDEEFEKKNEKSKNPIPPKPIKLDDIIPNPKFPKRYVKVLERMINSRLTPETKKFSHFSDIPGGAGAMKAQAGELMSLIGPTLSDDEWNTLSTRILEHEEKLINEHPDVFKKEQPKGSGKLKDNPGSRIVDKSWVDAAGKTRQAILKRLEKQYGKGTKIVASAWDTENEVEALGISDYKNNKGFSTDTYFKVEKPNGEQVLDEVSNKKSLKVNLLNSGIGDFQSWDPDLPDNLKQSVYREKARKRNIDFVDSKLDKVKKLIESDTPEGKEIKKLMERKGLTIEQALQGNSRDKQNILFKSIKGLRAQGDEDAGKIVQQDVEEHTSMVKRSVDAITENPKLKEGMLQSIREEFPLKAVSDKEETMALGEHSLDPTTMEEIFGTSDYDKIKEKLVSIPPKPELDKDGNPKVDKNGDPKMSAPMIGYQAEVGGETMPVADIGIREDGRGYGGQFKFEMIINKKFAKRMEAATKKIYGEES
tara:strand:- start:231 stop:2090 length:1860 start_codon:yes stop_codon:yes gene_type:complete